MTAGKAWVFDVDGCLVDSTTGTSLRPLTAELLVAVRERGISVVLWSAGGDEYARRRATQFGLEDQVAGCYGKDQRGRDGRWLVDHIRADHQPVLFVDDRPEELPVGVEAVGVRPYLGASPHDRGLAPLLERVLARRD
jgi:long-chain acyl-CoA synthetase